MKQAMSLDQYQDIRLALYDYYQEAAADALVVALDALLEKAGVELIWEGEP
jgi:hypothetical protein